MIGPFTESLGGKPISLTTVNPTFTDIHVMYSANGRGQANVHECVVCLSNSGSTAVIVDLRYNGASVQVTLPAHDARTVLITVAGDSNSEDIGTPILAAALAVGESGTILVAGGWEDNGR